MNRILIREPRYDELFKSKINDPTVIDTYCEVK